MLCEICAFPAAEVKNLNKRKLSREERLLLQKTRNNPALRNIEKKSRTNWGAVREWGNSTYFTMQEASAWRNSCGGDTDDSATKDLKLDLELIKESIKNDVSLSKKIFCGNDFNLLFCLFLHRL